MNLDVLKDLYLKDPRIFQLADKLSFAKPQQIFLDGLNGSSKEWVVNALFQTPAASQISHLVVMNDQEEAAYFHNTLEALTDNALNLFYFPSSFKNKKNYRLLNSSHVMLRTEGLTKLAASPNHNLIITYPEALFEKVVLAKELSSNIISIKQAETIDVNGLLELFVMLGFSRSDFVYEPGQFALRGGILDIYSFGNEKPYRVELFGNEVDSIRLFDPETQLSEKRLLSVNIIPNVDTKFDSGEKVSLLEFLPDNTAIWCNDWQFVKEILEAEEDNLEIYLALQEGNKEQGAKSKSQIKSDEEGEEVLSKNEVTWDEFVKAKDVEKQIANKHQVSFDSLFANDEEKPNRKADLVHLNFSTKPQPSFNRNFNLLIADLKSWEAQKFTIYLFSDQARQLERLYSIFRDLNTEINFVPVPIAIHGGFIDQDLKAVCYTDHQIFQRYHKYRVKQAFSKNKALTLKTLRDLQPGDYVTHIDHGVGIFSGLQKVEVGGKMQEAVRLRYRDNDLLYVNLSSLHKISKYTGKEGSVPKMNKLGSEVWAKLKDKTTKQIKDIAEDLIKLYAERKAQKGFQHSPDN